MTRVSSGRRAWFGASFALGLALVGLTFSSPALAGSYLNRAALLLDQAKKDTNYLRTRLHDRELCKLIEKLALARVAAASGMEVPKEVQRAHPHLLLVLEAHAQAAEAARLRDGTRFVVFAQRAWEEERTLLTVLKQLGWVLPN